MSSLLDDTKNLLKALLVSSPTELTINQLNRDYNEREGRDIPFQTLGYPNLELFLCKSMNDIMAYNPRNGVCKPIVAPDGKDAHILNLVTNQKKKEPRKRSNKSNRTNQSNHSNRQRPVKIWDTDPVAYNQQHQQINMQQRHQQPNHINVQRAHQQHQQINMQRPYQQHHSPGTLLAPPTIITPELLEMVKKIRARNNPTPGMISGYGLNGQANQNYKPRNEMAPKTLLVDAHVPPISSQKLNGCEVVGALPHLDDDDPIRFIGTNTMKYGNRIPPAILPKTLNTGDVHTVYVTEVTTFPHFYFQFNHTADIMRGMQDNLNLSYENAFADVIQPSRIQVGNVCTAFHGNNWSRAEILALPDKENRLKLLFVDYGTIDYVSIDCVRHLLADLCENPRLCHRGALAFVEPLHDYRIEQKTIKMFCGMVTGKPLAAVFSDVDEKKIISMTLVDTSHSDVDVIVNKILKENFTKLLVG